MMRNTVLASALLTISSVSWAGSIFLTGHDPDFHSVIGGNAAGAQAINQTAIGYITAPGFNSFTAGGISTFLFVESSISPPGGHVVGKNGIIASGYAEGTDFISVDASGLNAALDLLGVQYNALVIASDFGGVLTQAELDILNSRSGDIISFLNAGGGLYAMAESDSGAGLTPNGGFFGYLPFVVSSQQLNQNEIGNTVTPFGASLGLTDDNVNGNASHNIFTSASGMNIVDLDSQGNILTLAVRSQVSSGGLVPEPGAFALAALGFGFLALRRRLG